MLDETKETLPPRMQTPPPCKHTDHVSKSEHPADGALEANKIGNEGSEASPHCFLRCFLRCILSTGRWDLVRGKSAHIPARTRESTLGMRVGVDVDRRGLEERAPGNFKCQLSLHVQM